MNHAWRDVGGGLSYRDYWFTMAWNDIRSRYRRSRIGQFWITLSVALFVAGIGVVYAGLFGMPIADYMPRLTVSYVVWMFLSASLIGGCSTFISAAATMRQRPFPLSVHAYRLVARELMILAHNAIVVAVVWLLFGVGITAAALLAIAGLAINAYIAFWLAMLFGIVSVRYRDVPPITQSMVTILFFVTPVIWTPDRLAGPASLVVQINPFSHLIAIVRDPLLGVVPPAATWLVALGFAAVLTLLGLYGMSLTWRRLAYWL